MSNQVIDAEGASPSEGRNPLAFGLHTPESILAHTLTRANNYDTVEVANARDLAIRYFDNQEMPDRPGLYAAVPVRNKDGSIKERRLPLSDKALKMGCRLMPGQPQVEMFKAADDPNMFPKIFNHLMDRTTNEHPGFIVRHDGLQIKTFLRSDYVIKDAHNILKEVLPVLQENMGEIKGILPLEPASEALSYRIVMGNNLVRGVEEKHGQFLMMNINMSELGEFDTKTTMGLYRTFCTNSAIRVQTLSKWNHLSPFARYFDKVARVTRESQYLAESYGKIFSELLARKLPEPAMDLLHIFRNLKLISENHMTVALVHAQAEDVRSEYDLFNILTRSAQDLDSLADREQAEAASMKLFGSPEGMLEIIRREESRPRRKKLFGNLNEG